MRTVKKEIILSKIKRPALEFVSIKALVKVADFFILVILEILEFILSNKFVGIRQGILGLECIDMPATFDS